MSVYTPISIVLYFSTDAPIESVHAVLADVSRSVGHFPNVERFPALGGDKYRWEMENMGTRTITFKQGGRPSTNTATKKIGTAVTPCRKATGNSAVFGS